MSKKKKPGYKSTVTFVNNEAESRVLPRSIPTVLLFCVQIISMSGPSKKAKSEEMSDELTSALESIDGCQNEIDLLNEKVRIQGDSSVYLFVYSCVCP